MSPLLRYLKSTIGLKMLMAVTGLAMLLFLVGHLSGNMLFWSKDHAFDKYGHALTSSPFIYVAEAGLIAICLLHVWAALTLTARNRAARPQGYAKSGTKGGPSRRNWASSNMMISGVIILMFIVFHVWTMKFGPGLSEGYVIEEDGEKIRDLSRLMRETFADPIFAGLYGVAMLILLTHLWHAFSSAFQTIGVSYAKTIARVGQVIALILGLGFLSFPVIIYFIENSKGAQ